MSKVYLFLADGFETIEALAPVDIMRRAGLEVITVSIMGRKDVLSAQNVSVMADVLFEECNFEDADAVILPGGGVGTENLSAHSGVRSAVAQMNNNGRLIAAICAAPMVFGRMGLLDGRRATCYPGCEGELTGAEYTAAAVERDGNIVTGCGPGASLDFGYAIVDYLCEKGVADTIASQMQYKR